MITVSTGVISSSSGSEMTVISIGCESPIINMALRDTPMPIITPTEVNSMIHVVLSSIILYMVAVLKRFMITFLSGSFNTICMTPDREVELLDLLKEINSTLTDIQTSIKNIYDCQQSIQSSLIKMNERDRIRIRNP